MHTFLLLPMLKLPLPLALLQLIKYGVVRLSALQHDLRHWGTLYCAGRLQKPVVTLTAAATAPGAGAEAGSGMVGVEAAQAHNLLGALCCSLLMLPQRFSTEVGFGTAGRSLERAGACGAGVAREFTPNTRFLPIRTCAMQQRLSTPPTCWASMPTGSTKS